MRRWALSPQLVAFADTLRNAGLPVGSHDSLAALNALTTIPLGDAESFRLALRTTMTHSREAQAIFDQAYANFWLPEALPETAEDDTTPASDNESESSPAPAVSAGKTPLPTVGEPDDCQTDAHSTGASGQKGLLHRDFITVTVEEQAEIRKLVALIAARLATRVGRRWYRSYHGRLDLRASIRAALGHCGELLELHYKRRRRTRPGLLVVADVSYSMDSYSRFFLQFIHAFHGLFRRVETCVFSTELSRVTPALRRGEHNQALDALADAVEDWGGGTRIGASINQLLRGYGQLLDRHTIVMIVSDGWDTDAPAVLDDALRRLRSRCKRVIWLDPLQDNPRFFASAAGLQRASRWVDICLPARDLASLQQVADVLATTPWA